jgi:hypothetical protein
MPRPLQFDMVFLDHLKPLYTIDLKVLEEEGLVGPVSFSQLWSSGIICDRRLDQSLCDSPSLTFREPFSSQTTLSNPETQPTSPGSEPPQSKNALRSLPLRSRLNLLLRLILLPNNGRRRSATDRWKRRVGRQTRLRGSRPMETQNWFMEVRCWMAGTRTRERRMLAR